VKSRKFTIYARGVYNVAATKQGRALLKAAVKSTATYVAVAAKYATAATVAYVESKAPAGFTNGARA
jgi:hypothetical protein